MLRKILSITTAVLMGIVMAPTHADSTLKFSTGAGGEPNTLMIGQGKVRMESASPQGKSVMIFDDKSKSFIALHSQQKNYVVMDINTAKAQAKRMQEMRKEWMAQMQEQMKQMKPEQRQQMEQQMARMGMGTSQQKPPPRPDFSIKKTNKTEQVSGVNCTVYESFRGTEKLGDACIASPEALKISKTDYQTLKSMFAFQREIQKQFASAAGGPMPQSDMGMFDKIEGLAIKVTNPKGGTMKLASTSNAPLSPDLFQIPAGFKRVDPMSQKGAAPTGERRGGGYGQGGAAPQQPRGGYGYERQPQGGYQAPPGGGQQQGYPPRY